MESASQGQGKLEGEQSNAFPPSSTPPTPPGSPRPVRLARRAVTALGNICFCHYQYLPGALPAPHRPARPGRSRERGAGAQDKSPNGAEAVSGVCREEEGRTESQAQQRLQLNQFGDKNSACRPCLCSDFIKVSAALESQQASTCVPASTPNWRLETGSKIATPSGGCTSPASIHPPPS